MFAATFGLPGRAATRLLYRLRAALERRLVGLSAEEIRYTFEDVRAELRATRAELKAELADLRRDLARLERGALRRRPPRAGSDVEPTAGDHDAESGGEDVPSPASADGEVGASARHDAS